MALVNSVEGLRSQIITSIYGRRLGLDNNGSLVGITGYRLPVTGFDSTGATTGFNTTGETTLSAYGCSIIGSTASGSQAYTIQAPIPGVRKYIVNPTTATVTIATTAAGAYVVLSTNGAVTGTTISLARGGTNVTLLGITTYAWAMIGFNNSPTSASTYVTASV